MPGKLTIVTVLLAAATLVVAVVLAVQLSALRAEVDSLAQAAPEPGSAAPAQPQVAEAVLSLEDSIDAMRGELDRLTAQVRSGNEAVAALREASQNDSERGRFGAGGGGAPGGDNQRGAWTPPEPAAIAKQVAERVELDDATQTKLATVLEAQQTEMRTLFEQMRGGGDQAEQARESFRGMRERFAGQWAEVLNPEQVEALQATMRPDRGRGRSRWGRGGDRDGRDGDGRERDGDDRQNDKQAEATPPADNQF